MSTHLSIQEVETALANIDFSTIDGKSFEVFINDIAFLGFRPEVLHAQLQKAATVAGRDFSNDITSMIVLLAVRGSNIDKMVARMPTEGKQLVKTLKAAYKLISTARTQGSGVNATLPRIASLYPFVGVQLFLAKPDLTTVVSINKMRALIPSFPKVIMAPGFNSLVLPSSIDPHLKVLKAVGLFQLVFSKVVSPVTSTFDSIKKMVGTVLDNAAGSQFLPVELRIEWLVKGGVITYNSVSGSINLEGARYEVIEPVAKAADLYDQVVSGSDWIQGM
nr:MAG: putative nucleocapsid protein [Ips phenuiviral-like virus]